MESQTPPLLSLPQELRDWIFLYFFHSATATTEHPFPQCIPSGPRFRDYHSICLVNRALRRDARAYFTKHVAPKTTFYFTSVSQLQHFQYLALNRCPALEQSTFHIRCGNGTNSEAHPAMVSSASRSYQTRGQCEEVEALIRIQPGFKWWMDELPGFYRSKPATLTNYGYFPATRPSAWKPAKHGVAVCEQAGGEMCDSRNCFQRSRGSGRQPAFTEVHFPPLNQGHWPGNDVTPADLTETTIPGRKGRLALSCYLWAVQPDPDPRKTCEVSTMVLQGKFADVWIPEKVVEVELRKRMERME